MRSTYNQNLKCPDNVKKRLEGYKKTNPNLYKLWALGEYAEMKGVIFKNWDVVSEAPAGVDCAGYGLDFGFSSDPAACVKVWINSMEIWVEGILYSTDLTNDDLYDKLKGRIGQYDRIICDSAEPKTKEDLYRKGFKRIEGVKKRANYKAEMANILNGYKIHLIAGDMDLQREFSTWSWDEDKTGKLLPRPKDGNDHYIDAFIMLCHERIGRKSSVLY
jgi:phage terminase large subunit